MNKNSLNWSLLAYSSILGINKSDLSEPSLRCSSADVMLSAISTVSTSEIGLDSNLAFSSELCSSSFSTLTQCFLPVEFYRLYCGDAWFGGLKMNGDTWAFAVSGCFLFGDFFVCCGVGIFELRQVLSMLSFDTLLLLATGSLRPSSTSTNVRTSASCTWFVLGRSRSNASFTLANYD